MAMGVISGLAGLNHLSSTICNRGAVSARDTRRLRYTRNLNTKAVAETLQVSGRPVTLVWRSSDSMRQDQDCNFAPTLKGKTTMTARIASRLQTLAASAIVLGALSGSGAAFAADPMVDVTVTERPDSVSVSRTGLATYLAYDVVISNKSTNTINNARFGGKFTVPAGLANPLLVASATGPSCQAISTPAAPDFWDFECAIGQLRGVTNPASISAFRLVFKSPSGSALAGDGDLTLDWKAYTGEGSGDSGGAAHLDSFSGVAVTQIVTTSSEAIKKEVKSFVLSTGGSFFTGNGQVATPDDPWITRVDVPATSTGTTAEVKEYGGPGGVECTGSVTLPCFESVLTIPDTLLGYLYITLWRDASTIAPRAKIGDAQIFYDHDGGSFPSTTEPFLLGACTSLLPTAGVPCIESRYAYPKNGTPKAPVPAGAEGDWRFIIKALDNGRYLF